MTFETKYTDFSYLFYRINSGRTCNANW